MNNWATANKNISAKIMNPVSSTTPPLRRFTEGELVRAVYARHSHDGVSDNGQNVSVP